MLVARFQTNDKPWSDAVLPQDYRRTFARRLRPFLGPFQECERDGGPGTGEDFGPYRPRDEAIQRAVTKLTAAHQPGLTVFVANKAGKGVRAHLIEKDQPFGFVYHTVGDCRDSYPNIVTEHNAAGQQVKLQLPAMLAYHEAERLNGRPIRITGIGWRSCAYQCDLYESDPGRYAPCDSSRHPRGLAIDLENYDVNITPRAVRSLESVGFCFGVPSERWHAAFQECG